MQAAAFPAPPLRSYIVCAPGPIGPQRKRRRDKHAPLAAEHGQHHLERVAHCRRAAASRRNKAQRRVADLLHCSVLCAVCQ